MEAGAVKDDGSPMANMPMDASGAPAIGAMGLSINQTGTPPGKPLSQASSTTMVTFYANLFGP